MIDKKAVGERIRAIRLSLGYTMGEFGSKLGHKTGKSNVSRWERGENLPNSRVLSDIAFYGQVSVEELLHGLDTKVNIMDKFIEFVEKDRFREAYIFFDNEINGRFDSPEHDYAIEIAKEFIKQLEKEAKEG